MKTWTRAKIATLCGCCSEPIAMDSPVLELHGSGWVKVRCAGCAGEPIPSVMPEIVTQGETIKAKLAHRIDNWSPIRDFKIVQGGQS